MKSYKSLPAIPKHHSLLPYSYQIMLRDIRQAVARELRKQRRIEKLKGKANE